MSIEEIRDSVLELPQDERAKLAATLLASLPAVLDEEDGGIAEAHRRSRELDEDPNAACTWEEIRENLRSDWVEIVYHRLFQRDINAAVRYYDGEGGEALGDRFFSDLEKTVERVIEYPKSCHFIDAGLRRAPIKDFPYHVIYQENEKKVKFLILRHDRRHPSYGLWRRYK